MIAGLGEVNAAWSLAAPLAPSRAPYASQVSGAGGASAGEGFSAMLGAMASNAAETLKQGEAAALRGVRGELPLQQAVEAVMAAEQTLQTAIAIRDKAVSAYLEISRMTI